MSEKENQPRNCFLVSDLVEEVELIDDENGDKNDENLEMTWTDGMIGVMPVFDTKEHALAYCENDESQVVRMTEVSTNSKTKESNG